MIISLHGYLDSSNSMSGGRSHHSLQGWNSQCTKGLHFRTIKSTCFNIQLSGLGLDSKTDAFLKYTQQKAKIDIFSVQLLVSLW